MKRAVTAGADDLSAHAFPEIRHYRILRVAVLLRRTEYKVTVLFDQFLHNVVQFDPYLLLAGIWVVNK